MSYEAMNRSERREWDRQNPVKKRAPETPTPSDTPSPVAPVTGLPEALKLLPETMMVSIRLSGEPRFHERDEFCIANGCTPVEVLPVGSRDRLRALEAAVKTAHGLISATVLGFILGKNPTPGAEAEVNRVVDLLATFAALPESNPCLCGHTLSQHTPDKNIGCTGFRKA